VIDSDLMNEMDAVRILSGCVLKAAVFSLGGFPKSLVKSVEAERRCRIYKGEIEVILLLEDLLYFSWFTPRSCQESVPAVVSITRIGGA